MTCISAVAHNGRVTMGCDSAGTYDNFNIVEFGHSKILSLAKGQILVGCCGSCRMLDLLEFHLNLPSPPKKPDQLRRWMVREFIQRSRLVFHEGGLTFTKNGVEEFDGALLVAARGRLFSVECDFDVGELEGFAAIGSGGSFATGSLYSTARQPQSSPEGRVLEALECSERYNAAVRRPFKVVTL